MCVYIYVYIALYAVCVYNVYYAYMPLKHIIYKHIYLFIHPSIYHPSTHPSIHLSIFLSDNIKIGVVKQGYINNQHLIWENALSQNLWRYMYKCALEMLIFVMIVCNCLCLSVIGVKGRQPEERVSSAVNNKQT